MTFPRYLLFELFSTPGRSLSIKANGSDIEGGVTRLGDCSHKACQPSCTEHGHRVFGDRFRVRLQIIVCGCLEFAGSQTHSLYLLLRRTWDKYGNSMCSCNEWSAVSIVLPPGYAQQADLVVPGFRTLEARSAPLPYPKICCSCPWCSSGPWPAMSQGCLTVRA